MAKNTTLSRKAGNDMKKEQDNRSTRNSVGPDDLAFNGQAGTGVNREANRWAGNQYGATMKENYGEKAFARRGNTSDQSVDRLESVGPSATRDPLKQTISTAAGGPVTGKTEVKRFKNPDAIYMGK